MSEICPTASFNLCAFVSARQDKNAAAECPLLVQRGHPPPIALLHNLLLDKFNRDRLNTGETMLINSQLVSEQISRRAVLGTAAAVVATPALAQVCPIGPPTHEKGPRVWMDMDQIELDAAYD